VCGQEDLSYACWLEPISKEVLNENNGNKFMNATEG